MNATRGKMVTYISRAQAVGTMAAPEGTADSSLGSSSLAATGRAEFSSTASSANIDIKPFWDKVRKEELLSFVCI